MTTAIRRVLGATDFSAGARAAAAWAGRVAKSRGADFHLIHAVPHETTLPTAGGLVHEHELRQTVLNERRAQLEAEGEAVHATTTLLVEGKPVETIARLANELAVDLVVVGRHGREEAYLVGHVAERVVRVAHASVISVPPRFLPRAASPLERVLCPTDLSPGADRALADALALAARLGVQAHVLHVVDLPSYVLRQTDLAAELERVVNHEVQDLIARHRQGGAQIQQIIRRGAAGEVIAQVADELDVDAILIPTHARSGVARFFLGSVAERLIRTAERPVWTFRRGTE